MQKQFFASGSVIYLLALVGALAYVGFFYAGLEGATQAFEKANAASPAIRAFSMASADKYGPLFVRYGAALGGAFFVLFLIKAGVLALLAKISTLDRFRPTYSLIALLATAPCLTLSGNIVYYAHRTNVIGNAIISYLAGPLFYASILTAVLSLVAMILSLVLKSGERPSGRIDGQMIALVALLAFSLTGCSDWLAMAMGSACTLSEDSGHCYQAAALQSNDAEQCAKVKSPEQFKSLGSNPPQDKCYYQIAQNKGEADICKRIQGGVGSYDPAECVKDVAVEKLDPSACASIPGEASVCANKVGQSLYADIEKKLKSNQASKEELAKMQNKLDQMKQYYDSLSGVMKTQHDIQQATLRNLR